MSLDGFTVNYFQDKYLIYPITTGGIAGYQTKSPVLGVDKLLPFYKWIIYNQITRQQ